MIKKKQQKNNFTEGEEKNSSPSVLKRKCVACNKLFERSQLIRIMHVNNSDKIVINPDNKTFGRSAYICNSNECFETARKKNRFAKVLKTNIDENILEKLKIMIN